MESANNFPELLETCGMIYLSGTSSTAACASNTPTSITACHSSPPHSDFEKVTYPDSLPTKHEKNLETISNEKTHIKQAKQVEPHNTTRSYNADLNCGLEAPVLSQQPGKQKARPSRDGLIRRRHPQKIMSQRLDPNLSEVGKKAHNQNEKRYRDNINAKFEQLEDITRSCAIKTEDLNGIDGKSKKGRKPSRKALVLQNACNCIAGLKAELLLLRKEVDKHGISV
ncbi:hypothetical protein BDV36DRAFT_302916 [Aspergillus pseudocaelatus]|uniref:BHLH domain-containing protein n=1 Tax=Aspergillus pseudocaelatus TaxID=1825620 RepID=A0ABQ6VZD2_9EURO|nr:hypothetical protein BDV36DRAFT_302916 [Aspergillus pseudocaelatus]